MFEVRLVIRSLVIIFFICLTGSCNQGNGNTRTKTEKFRVIGFYKEINDSETAHLSVVHEANRWFTAMAAKNNFDYDSTSNWKNLNDKFLANYKVVIFFDARPDSLPERNAFRKFIENGGGWMGFHFAGFALTPSGVPQDWDWYHNTFLGSGEYKGNTWRPTSAVLRVEDKTHPATKDLPETFVSAPNEWYSWKNDLRKNPDIKILLSIDSTSFPLGTGPKLYEIWHSGYYPVVWTNTKYKMLYINMGHNDIDFENKTNNELSFTFKNEIQNKLILNGILWLGAQN
jgi:uncharacterized protein